jgi:6-phosphogluconolactonase
VADLDAAPAELRILPGPDAVASIAVDLTVDVLARGIAAGRSVHLALTGGSTAVPFFHELARPELRAQLDWRQVHLWWGDERLVPLADAQSNAGLAERLLLGGRALVEAANVHPVPVEEMSDEREAGERAAAAYAAELTRLLPISGGGEPVFDVILAGIGSDGHVLSIFPGSPALAPGAPIAMAIPAPQHVEPHLPRVTLAARLLPVARQLVVMANGAGKADIVHKVLGPDRDPRRWPIQSALLPNAVWLIDREAAGG